MQEQRWEFIKENKKKRKKELDQESDQENKKVTKKKWKNFLFFLFSFIIPTFYGIMREQIPLCETVFRPAKYFAGKLRVFSFQFSFDGINRWKEQLSYDLLYAIYSDQ